MESKSSRLRLAATLVCIACATCAAETTENNSQSAVQASSEPASEKNAEQLSIVLAIEADAEFGAYLGGECLTCHSPGEGDGSIPLIHGKNKEYLASALLEYKNQQRTSEVMRGVTAALTDEEIAALAAYFSEQ